MPVFVDAIGLTELGDYFTRLPDKARQAASLAINQTAERQGLKAAREAMQQQVAFPRGYLTTDRFGITQKATPGNLVAVIRGRFTPTSLARFVAPGTRAGLRRGTGVTVTVNPGRPTPLPRAFLLHLRGGNLGLAIRLRAGEQLRNRRFAVRTITTGPLKGVALLYGPSVDQVFRTVAGEIVPEVEAALKTEFLRQFVRLTSI